MKIEAELEMCIYRAADQLWSLLIDDKKTPESKNRSRAKNQSTEEPSGGGCGGPS